MCISPPEVFTLNFGQHTCCSPRRHADNDDASTFPAVPQTPSATRDGLFDGRCITVMDHDVSSAPQSKPDAGPDKT